MPFLLGFSVVLLLACYLLKLSKMHKDNSITNRDASQPIDGGASLLDLRG